ncbi:MAG: ROK family protein [Deltaproteobacteria bacterium]|nr:ROK family protein [Deltaproteobacteria bacterium]
MSKRATRYTIGLDLGGTKLAAALVNHRGEIVDSTKVPVGFRDSETSAIAQRRLVSLMAEICVDFRRRYPSEAKRLKGIGLASAGPLNVDDGELINPVNFPKWKTVPIRKMLEAELRRNDMPFKVAFQNDAIASALAEGWVGGAKNMSSYAVVTVGTGIGTGVIFNGRPCQSRGMGSEFGHLIFDGTKLGAESRKHLSIEGIASGTALLRRARADGFSGYSVEELVERIQSGETKWLPLFDDMARALSVLCYSLSIGFNLEGILFSGGLLKVRELYLAKTKDYYRQLITEFNPRFECRLQPAKTRQAAGVIGAAYLPLLATTQPKQKKR